jgi:hypothetical protein
MSSGVPEMDELLNGGIDRGGITLITGPSGVGKTTLGIQFMKEAAGRGDRCALYSFEEEVQSMLHRSASVNIPAESMVSRGTLSLVKVEPLRYSADEFAHLVRRDVVEKGTRVVMLDGVNGYRLAVRGGGGGPDSSSPRSLQVPAEPRGNRAAAQRSRGHHRRVPRDGTRHQLHGGQHNVLPLR